VCVWAPHSRPGRLNPLAWSVRGVSDLLPWCCAACAGGAEGVATAGPPCHAAALGIATPAAVHAALRGAAAYWRCRMPNLYTLYYLSRVIALPVPVGSLLGGERRVASIAVVGAPLHIDSRPALSRAQSTLCLLCSIAQL
jgi:hypothetical protein